MNKQRRKAIERIVAGLLGLPTDELELLKEAIEEVKDAEQEAYEGLPESLQNGEKGEAMQEAVNQLETAGEALQEMIDAYERMTEALEAAQA